MRRKRTQRTHQALANLAGRQHGVVSIRQLTGPLGYSESAVNRAVRAGRLHRLHRGVYAVGHRRLTRQGECLAAVLGAGPGSLLSHGSAAWLWGLGPRTPLPLTVTTPDHRRTRPRIRLHHARCLAKEDRALREGIPVTALPRTLLDLAATVPVKRLRKTIERAEELKLFDLGPVESVLARNVGHRGSGRLRDALALYRPASLTRSGLEERFLDLVLQAGLPRPSTNFTELGLELDAYWPEHRFAVELDAFETHGSREAFERDRIRQEELKLAGIEMIRVTEARLEREPDEVIRRVALLLRGRGGRTDSRRRRRRG
jgi:hypothetical protein